VDLSGDRRLVVQHNVLNRILLEDVDAQRVLQHLADLWGYDVVLKEVDASTGAELKQHTASARHTFF
jgi:stage V sporulation protein R